MASPNCWSYCSGLSVLIAYGATRANEFDDDVIKWKHFPRYWPFGRGIHRSPVNSLHKSQWRGALMFFFYLRLNKRLSKQSLGWWCETPSCSLWRHYNVTEHRRIRMGWVNVWDIGSWILPLKSMNCRRPCKNSLEIKLNGCRIGHEIFVYGREYSYKEYRSIAVVVWVFICIQILITPLRFLNKPVPKSISKPYLHVQGLSLFEGVYRWLSCIQLWWSVNEQSFNDTQYMWSRRNGLYTLIYRVILHSMFIFFIRYMLAFVYKTILILCIRQYQKWHNNSCTFWTLFDIYDYKMRKNTSMFYILTNSFDSVYKRIAKNCYPDLCNDILCTYQIEMNNSNQVTFCIYELWSVRVNSPSTEYIPTTYFVIVPAITTATTTTYC